LQLSDTDNNFKFSKGDWVIITAVRSNGGYTNLLKKPTGKIINSEFGLKEPIYTVELYGVLVRFPESDLIHQNQDDERDWKLKKLLK